MNPLVSYAVAAFLGLVVLVALAGIKAPALEEPARTGMRVGHWATVAVVLLDVVSLLNGHEVASRTTHIGYAVAAVGLPTILLTRRPDPDAEGVEGEESGGAVEPPHLGVVAVTAAAMAVLVVRLQQTW